jgi:uncharacterized protein (DUF433 family)
MLKLPAQDILMAKPHLRAFTHVVRDPRILEGEPVIQGTRVPIRSIIVLSRMYPDIARLTQAFPSLNVALLEEALAFYRANRVEIDRFIAENEADDEP